MHSPHPAAIPRVARYRALAAAALLVTGHSGPARADEAARPHWLVLDSPHFSVHHPADLQETARRVRDAAEEAYPRLRRAFDAAEGPRIPIILEPGTVFNGEAEPLKDRITLDPTLANSSVIGTRRFVAHELAHVMTFRALRQPHPLARLSGLGGLPAWFLEGIAQLEAEAWTPSLDRMLRLASLDHALLSPTERTYFRQLGLHAGAAGYNEGFALCREIFGGPGNPRLAQLFRLLRAGGHTFEQAVAAVAGLPLADLEARWRERLAGRYARQVAGWEGWPARAVPLVPTEDGEVHTGPRHAPDGRRIAFLTSRRQDGFAYLRGRPLGLLSLAVAAADGSDVRLLPVGAGCLPAFDWSPDGRELALVRLSREAGGAVSADLYVHTLATGRTVRLTRGQHVAAVAWRPRSNELACVLVKDGRNALAAVDRRTGRLQPVRSAPGVEQWRDLAFDASGERLAGVAFEPGEGGRLFRLGWWRRDLLPLTPVPPRGGDAAPSWLPDGRGLVYSSDRSGLANLVALDLATGRTQALTRTWRGAEGPSVAPDGRTVVFSAFLARGASLLRLPLPARAGPPGPTPDVPAAATVPAPAVGAAPPIPWAPEPLPTTSLGFGRGGPGEGPGTGGPGAAGEQVAGRPYTSVLTGDLMMPQMTSDERGQQLGFTALHSDVLRQQELALDVRWGLLSRRFGYGAAYSNRTGPLPWTVRLFDAPRLGLAAAADGAGPSVLQGLHLQRIQGAEVGLHLPLGGATALHVTAQAAHLGVLTPPAAGTAVAPREGALRTVGALLVDQRLTPTLDQALNPTEGYRLTLGWTHGAPLLGSAFAFDQFLVQCERHHAVLPAWRHNLTWRWSAGAVLGEGPQPLLLGGPASGGTLFGLRGHAVGARSGPRLATAGVEYTLPLGPHLNRTLGPLYLDRLYASAFVEAGTAWGAPEAPAPLGAAGVELRLRTLLGAGQALPVRLGLARRLGTLEWPGVYVAF